MNKKLLYLGVDIGGAHIKIVGLDQSKNICLVKYRKCYLWRDPKKLTQVDSYMISNLNIINYFKYLFLTLFGKGRGDKIMDI